MPNRATNIEVADNIMKIRTYLINGLTYDQVQNTMNMNRTTFRRYMQKIYDEDQILLQEKTERYIASDIRLYHDRLSKALVDLTVLFNDPNTLIKEKIEIIKLKSLISEQLVKIDKEGTMFMKLNPELEGFIDEASSKVRNKIQINNIVQNNYNNKDKNKVIKIKPTGNTNGEISDDVSDEIEDDVIV